MTHGPRTLGRRDFLQKAGLAALGGAALGSAPLRLSAHPPRQCAARVKRGNPSTLNIVAIGDSIVWGQGLLPEQKFTFRTRDWLANRMGVPATLTVFARSGAIIGNGTGAEPPCYLNGEVPFSNPTIRLQANIAAGLGQTSGCLPTTAPAAARGDVDLVLIDGGMNDIGIYNVLDPFTASAPAPIVSSLCDERMATLLMTLPALFPNAKFVVTGYYPIISSQSVTPLVVDLLKALGVIVGGVAGYVSGSPVVGTLASIGTTMTAERLVSVSVARAERFYTLITAGLKTAVDGANAMVGRTDFMFADPGFAGENAYGAPDRWTFLVDEEDPARTMRVPSCQAIYGNLAPTLTRGECWNASMGHPTPRGAEAYFGAVTTALTTLFPYCA